jgi:hypothetical protein
VLLAAAVRGRASIAADGLRQEAVAGPSGTIGAGARALFAAAVLVAALGPVLDTWVAPGSRLSTS